MESFYLIAPVILLLALGIAFKHFGFLNESDVQCMAKLVYWVVSPSLFFRAAMRTKMNWGDHINLIAAIYIAVALVALLAFCVGRFLLRSREETLSVSVLASFRSNSFSLGLPVIRLLMGDAVMPVMAVYFAVTETGYNLMSSLTGELSRSSRGADHRLIVTKAIRGVITNPMVTSSLLGLTLSGMGIHSMPPTIDKVFLLIGDMAAGLSVLMVGASLRLNHLGKNFTRLLPDCFIRLVLHPAILLACFAFFPVPFEIKKITILLTATPTAIIAFVMSKGMGLDSEYAAELIGVTTLLFVATLPLWIKFLQAA